MEETTNPFIELRDLLREINNFLEENEETGRVLEVIKSALNLVSMFADLEKLSQLFQEIVDILKQIKQKIEDFDPAKPGFSKVSEFFDKVNRLLKATQDLFEIPEKNLKGMDLLSTLDSLEEVKAEIKTLLDILIGHMESLKAETTE